MPSLIYNSCLLDMASGRLNFASDQFAAMLLSSEYDPEKREHSTRADVENFEVSGLGYRSGGQVADVSANLDDQDGLVIALGSSRWAKATITARYAAYYRRSGSEAQHDELIAVIDFGEDVSSTNGAFIVSESILRIQN